MREYVSHILYSVSCEFWEIFKNIFFTEHLLATPSRISGNLEQKKYFTDHQTADTIQLFVHMKS